MLRKGNGKKVTLSFGGTTHLHRKEGNLSKVSLSEGVEENCMRRDQRGGDDLSQDP